MKAIVRFLESTKRQSHLHGFLTPAQAKERIVNGHKSLITHTHRSNSGNRVFFFSDDHCYGYKSEAEKIEFTPATMAFPLFMSVKGGWIETVDQYLEVFHKDDTLLDTYESLVDFLERNPDSCSGIAD